MDNLQYRIIFTGLNMEDEPEYLWGEDGVLLTDNCDQVVNASIGRSGRYDYLAVWNDTGVIYAQKLCNGVSMWEYPGIELINMTNIDYHRIYIIEDYIVLAYPDNFYITRLAEDGSWQPGWNGFQSMPVGYAIDMNVWLECSDIGLKLIWEDSIDQIKAQIISPEGNFLYGNEGYVLIEDDQLSSNSLQVVYDNEISYLCYFDHASLQFSVWDNTFILQHANSIVTDKCCSKMVKKDDYLLMTRCEIGNMYFTNYLDLFAIDLQGNPAEILENNPTVIIDEWWDMRIIDLLVDDEYAYLVWYDWRNNMSHEYSSGFQPLGGNRIYAQKVALEMNSEDIDQISAVSQLQVYPNPFNTEVKISWQLAKRCEDSRLVIFNIKGQMVQDYAVQTNTGQITWDGRDASHQQCASGIYLIRLQNGSEKQTAKVLMLK